MKINSNWKCFFMLCVLFGMFLFGVTSCAKIEDKTTTTNTAPLDCVGTSRAIADLLSSGKAVEAVETYFHYSSEVEKQQRIDSISPPNEELKNDIIQGFANPEIVFDGSSYCELAYNSSLPGFGSISIILRSDYTGSWLVTGF